MTGCSDDKGDYEYATLTAEMADVNSAEAKHIVSALTDDDRRLTFSNTVNASWATTPDSTYRALIYYNKEDGDAVRMVSIQQALYLRPRTLKEAEKWSGDHDPLSLEALWLSKNGRYLNMRLGVKTGTPSDDTQRHTIGVVCDTITSDGHHYHYRLCHAQNNIPAYYTVTTYASIPIADIASGDTISLVVPTWEGERRSEGVKK